jgi:hypothetical protein
MISYNMYISFMSTNQTFAAPEPDRAYDRIAQQHRIEHTAVSAALGWSGWGSPIGLGIFVVSIGFLLLCLHWAGIVH